MVVAMACLVIADSAISQTPKCEYNVYQPSLDNALMSILTSRFRCAQEEIQSLLQNKSLDDKTFADAHILLAHAAYGLKDDSETVISHFYNAFRAHPGWHGDVHFVDPEFKILMKDGRTRAVEYFVEGTNLIMIAGSGLSFPATPGFSDRWRKGYHIQGGAGIRISRVFDIFGQVEIHRFDIENFYPAYDSVYQTTSGNLKSLMFGVTGRINLHMLNFRLGRRDAKSVPRFYLLFGIGGANKSVSQITFKDAPTIGESEVTNFFFSYGICAEVRVYKRIRLFMQGRLVHLFEAAGGVYSPVTLGIRY
jgi:hypothetical protein